jgi:hypothetical protein
VPPTTEDLYVADVNIDRAELRGLVDWQLYSVGQLTGGSTLGVPTGAPSLRELPSTLVTRFVYVGNQVSPRSVSAYTICNVVTETVSAGG